MVCLHWCSSVLQYQDICLSNVCHLFVVWYCIVLKMNWIVDFVGKSGAFDWMMSIFRHNLYILHTIRAIDMNAFSILTRKIEPGYTIKIVNILPQAILWKNILCICCSSSCQWALVSISDTKLQTVNRDVVALDVHLVEKYLNLYLTE